MVCKRSCRRIANTDKTLRVLCLRCSDRQETRLSQAWSQLPLLHTLECVIADDATLFSNARMPRTAPAATVMLPALQQLTMLLERSPEDTSDHDEDYASAAQMFSWLPDQLVQLTSLSALSLKHDFGFHGEFSVPYCDALLDRAGTALAQLRELRLRGAVIQDKACLARLPLAIASLTLLTLDRCRLHNDFCDHAPAPQLKWLRLTGCLLSDSSMLSLATGATCKECGLQVLDLAENEFSDVVNVSTVLEAVETSGVRFVALSYSGAYSAAKDKVFK